MLFKRCFLTQKMVLVLIPTFIYTIEHQICNGIAEVFADQTIKLIFAPVQYLPESEAELDRCLWIHHQFRALEPSAIIGYGGGLGSVSGNRSYQKVLDIYAGMPIVNIGSALASVPSVLVDNFDGMYELMVNIIRRRPKARFLFISGPEGNVDSQLRQQALYRAFTESGRSSDEIEVLVGNYMSYGARTLLDSYLAAGAPAEVIVCANDLTAKGVLDSLKAHGVRCPEDCWVTGYDDFEYAAATHPGLTTVHFPAKALGARAAEQVLALFAGPSVRLKDRVLKGFPVFRGTTGNLSVQIRDYDQQMFEQGTHIHQRDHHTRTLELMRMLKRQVPLSELLANTKGLLAELEVAQLSLFRLTRDEDGSRYYTGMSLDGMDSTIRFAKPEIPSSYLDSSPLCFTLICPLEFDDEHFGYIVASCAPIAAKVIEAIGIQLSELLHAEVLLDTSENYRQVNELSARMASLGSLVSGVAHEINTPIGTAKLAASSFIDSTQALQAHITANRLTRTNFDTYLAESNEYAEIIFQSLNRAANLISNFKLVAVDQTAEKKRSFDLGDYVASVLVSLRHQLKGTQVVLTTDLASGIIVDTYPGAVAQVVTNLFMNALNHGFDGGALAGTIAVRLKKTQSGFEMSTQDNGKGALDDVLSQIFDPFFTTSRGKGGSGLGMHIVYNLVSQKLFWTIQVQSSDGQGFKAILKSAGLQQGPVTTKTEPIHL